MSVTRIVIIGGGFGGSHLKGLQD